MLLGVHACDINALKILDKTYLRPPPDPYYKRRREKTIIIGVSCIPDEFCFCKSLGKDYATDGFDLFLHKLPDGYLVRIGSPRGYSIIRRSLDLFSNVSGEDMRNLAEFEERRARSFKKEVEVRAFTDLLDLSFDSQIWEECGKMCIECGNCNLVCPTCWCYEVVDQWIDAERASRIRRYDSCFTITHALVAGGYNFRPTKLDRFRHRYYCKSYSDPEDGVNCVGCGRCEEFCPAGISYPEVINRVIKG